MQRKTPVGRKIFTE